MTRLLTDLRALLALLLAAACLSLTPAVADDAPTETTEPMPEATVGDDGTATPGDPATPIESGGSTDGAEPDGDETRTAQLAGPDIAPPETWRWGGWVSSGMVLLDTDDEQAFGHSLLTVQAPAGGDPILGFFTPYAIDTYALVLDHGGYVDGDVYATLTSGGESDAPNWSIFARTSEGTNERSAMGVGYWVDAFQDDGDVRWQSLMVQAFLTEGGNMGAGGQGWWGLNKKDPWNYMVIARGSWEPDGHDKGRGVIALRHYTDPNLTGFFEGGAFNAADRRGWGVFVAYGAQL